MLIHVFYLSIIIILIFSSCYLMDVLEKMQQSDLMQIRKLRRECELKINELEEELEVQKVLLEAYRYSRKESSNEREERI